jgi:hypothetical protein
MREAGGQCSACTTKVLWEAGISSACLERGGWQGAGRQVGLVCNCTDVGQVLHSSQPAPAVAATAAAAQSKLQHSSFVNGVSKARQQQCSPAYAVDPAVVPNRPATTQASDSTASARLMTSDGGLGAPLSRAAAK